MSRSPAQPARALRLLAVVERDGPTCIWCGRTFAPLIGPTTEHVVPRVKGGQRRARPYLDAQLRRLRRRGGGRALPA